MEPYIPEKLPLNSINWDSLLEKIIQANTDLAEYNGMLMGINNPDLLLTPLRTQEAVLSSKIEGTQATLEDVLRYEADPIEATEKKEDIIEILNYRKAMNHAVTSMKEKPVNLNMIKDIHGILLTSVRGKTKKPGEFRKDQNYIGKMGEGIEYAAYIPPNPLMLDECLNNFINYFHFAERDRLVQAAIMHAQFEIIHPFDDGNGRIGRLLIPLFLYENQKIFQPYFYISAYFDQNRETYYSGLKAISDHKDWTGWIKFFLTAITTQALKNSSKVLKIMLLYKKLKEELPAIINTKYIMGIIDTIFKMPLITNAEFSKVSKIPQASTARVINDLTKNKILVEVRKGTGRRAKIVAFDELIKIIA
jgi:Fic family protein